MLAYGIGYAYAGWAACGLAGAGYVVALLRRGRKVVDQVPEDRRRWSDPS